MSRQLAPRPFDRRTGTWPRLEGTRRADPRGDRDPEPTGIVTRPRPALPPGTPEHVLAQLAEHSAGVAALSDKMARLLDALAGPRVLETATITIPATGVYEAGHYRVPYASVAVLNTSTTALVVSSAAAQGSAPGGGQGQIAVPASSFIAWPLAGSALSIYGAANSVVTFSAFIDRVQPSAATI